MVAGFASDRVGAVACGEVIVPATGSGHCSAPPPSVVSEPGVRISPPSSPHTLLKVSDICGLTGEIGFHDTDTGYLVSFPDDDGKADQRMDEYKKRLVDLENNIWNR